MSNNSAIITGGIGDALAIESFLTDFDRNCLTTLYYATRQHQSIKKIFQSLPNYTNLKNHIVLWQDTEDFWCYYSKKECLNKLGLDITANDWSVLVRFHELTPKEYTYSSVLKYNLCKLNLILPEPYIVIVPYSYNNEIIDRNFDDNDWVNTLEYIHYNNYYGIILGTTVGFIPNDKKLIDLINKTDIIESIEILKKAVNYIGIDSSLSVLAAKLFDNLFVKSNNDFCYRYKHLYYSPRQDFNFLTRYIL